MIEEIQRLIEEFDQVDESLTRDDWVDWKSNPVTQQLFREAKTNFIKLLDDLEDVPLDTRTIAIASESKGERNIFQWLLGWEIDDDEPESN